MNPDKIDETDVPAGWELCISKKNTNRKYYFNRKTGESSWTKPQAIKSPQGYNKPKKSKDEYKPKEKAIKDEIKKILKRKSDGYISHASSTYKKPKDDKPPPEKPVQNSPAKKRASTGSIRESPKYTSKGYKLVDRAHSPPKKSPKPSPSPAKRAKEAPNISRDPYPSPKPPLSKNTANARLSQLRADLSAEIKQEENDEPIITNATTVKLTPEKVKHEPVSNDTQNNTQSHSPNESAQSIISPSQFFAANKIIYSMKAQLPDRDTRKPKDAFADIEEGINNQTTEYPFMKHPATPPQFTEASKLISAINSKLSYRKDPPVETLVNIFKSAEQLNNADTPTSVYNVFKSANTMVYTNTYEFAEMPVLSREVDAPVSSYGSAKERMDTLKKRLSNEAMDTHAEADSNTVIEDMDVDKEVKYIPEPKKAPPINSKATSKDNVILVVDTNIFIHELDFIKNIMNSHIEGYKEQPTLVVPWRVINELDKLKDSNNGNGAICKRARPAMDYLYKSLPNNQNRIKVQPLREANSHIFPCESPDDEILNCCFQQAEKGIPVILLSNDKNLCTKAVANGVETKQLRSLVLKPHNLSPTTPLSAARLKRPIFKLLSNILENEMRAKYDKIWQRVVFKPPPWKLSDVLMCLLKHWIAVFNEVFPRIEYLIMDLKNSLGVLESKNPSTITQAEVSSFKDLCLEVAKRCQIIPEYMQLAKTTVERLESDNPGDSDDDENEIDEAAVVEAFEGVWTVFSSYCAKLATAIGVEHTIEDKLPGTDTVDTLTSKLPLFDNHISTLAENMEAVLNVAANSPLFMDNVARLEHVLKCSQKELGLNNKVNNASIRLFCFKCRSMLQEARGKFCELVKLLNVCKTTLEILTNIGTILPTWKLSPGELLPSV